MTDPKTIAFFPEASFGAALNCVGIAQKIRDLGHEAVFLCDVGFAGTFEAYGFREFPVTMSPDMSEEELEQFWANFIARHLPHFRLSPEEQLSTYVLDCWNAIIDSVIMAEHHLHRQLEAIRPDVVCVDNVILFPAATRAGCPWVRIVSCAETEIPDPAIPPLMSALGATDGDQFKAFATTYNRTVEPAHARFNTFLDSIGHATYPAGEFFEASPDLNLMLYAEPLRYTRQTPLEPERFVYLEGSVRDEGPYTPPGFPVHDDKPLVYLSFGSLGAADVALLERMIRLFSTLPYRFLINVGGYKDSYRFVPDNVQLDYWFPQPSVIAQSDLVIHHGGNNSVHEALYFGKPAIVMPYCWDGHDNARRIADQDLGIHLDRYEWRDGDLIESIETLMTGKARHKRLAAIAKDMQAFDGCTRAAEAILKCAGV